MEEYTLHRPTPASAGSLPRSPTLTIQGLRQVRSPSVPEIGVPAAKGAAARAPTPARPHPACVTRTKQRPMEDWKRVFPKEALTLSNPKRKRNESGVARTLHVSKQIDGCPRVKSVACEASTVGYPQPLPCGSHCYGPQGHDPTHGVSQQHQRTWRSAFYVCFPSGVWTDIGLEPCEFEFQMTRPFCCQHMPSDTEILDRYAFSI